MNTKAIVVSLLFSLSFCLSGCKDDKAKVHPAPSSLTNVAIDLEEKPASENVVLTLTLNTDGTATLYSRVSLCCWKIDSGTYTYTKAGKNTGEVSVSYVLTETFASVGSTGATANEFSEIYRLTFVDDFLGTYVKTGGEGNTKGDFTVESIAH